MACNITAIPGCSEPQYVPGQFVTAKRWCAAFYEFPKFFVSLLSIDPFPSLALLFLRMKSRRLSRHSPQIFAPKLSEEIHVH